MRFLESFRIFLQLLEAAQGRAQFNEEIFVDRSYARRGCELCRNAR